MLQTTLLGKIGTLKEGKQKNSLKKSDFTKRNTANSEGSFSERLQFYMNNKILTFHEIHGFMRDIGKYFAKLNSKNYDFFFSVFLSVFCMPSS